MYMNRRGRRAAAARRRGMLAATAPLLYYGGVGGVRARIAGAMRRTANVAYSGGWKAFARRRHTILQPPASCVAAKMT